MRSPARHGIQSLLSGRESGRQVAPVIPTHIKPRIRGQTHWTCADCRLRNQASQLQPFRFPGKACSTIKRLSTSHPRQQGNKAESLKPTSPTTTASLSRPARDSNTAASALPSHTEEQRWQVSKQLTKFMDRLLVRASVAGQHINSYTGTDYSGIEVLRREIIEQEQKVRTSHNLVDKKKAHHHEASAKQASAQKEIVGLLERKSSWSPTDLERYMSLVRSEHVNDQAVQAAKDTLAAAERELEDSRSFLEKLERKQYHEEQIWSDTIRRNSTWVTFGLMGVNIVLLLAQITVFEPYRRRKIVRDVKDALDEKTLLAPSGEVEKQIDEVMEAFVTPAEAPEQLLMSTSVHSDQPLDVILPQKEDDGEAPLAAGWVLPAEAVEFVPRHEQMSSWEAYKEAFRDLFSERVVQIKQVDVTTIALQGTASGVAVMGLLFVLLRPR